jgi:hypothetical protein
LLAKRLAVELALLVPITVKTNPCSPAAAELGMMLVSKGGGIRILNGSEPEAPPPGVYTVTPAVPAVAISDSRIEPCNWLELTYVVVRLDPFNRITEFVVKFEPAAVRMKPGPPAVAEVGDIEPRMGTGGAAIVKVLAEEAPMPGLYTVTPAVPIVAISDARIEPCNRMELT